MKVWNGYGSEHSMNLVLIGKFKRAQDAEKVERDIAKLSDQALKDDARTISSAPPEDQRFSHEMLALLRSLNMNILGPTDLEQLISDHRLEREEDRITVTTDEVEVSAFVKIFIEAGAKVEVFSAHYHSDTPADGLTLRDSDA